MDEIYKGRVWMFGDEMNTDLMVPSNAMTLPEPEMIKYCFSSNRPGWVDLIQQGDIIVAGKNFGIGSSRPGAKSLKLLGISCLLAESINGLFLRNSINFGFPLLPCPEITSIFEEGDMAEVIFNQGKIRNITRDIEMEVPPLPDMLLKIITAGGLIPMLYASGCLV